MDASADLLKVNHRLESRVPEIGLLGSEGGATSSVVPTPIVDGWKLLPVTYWQTSSRICAKTKIVGALAAGYAFWTPPTFRNRAARAVTGAFITAYGCRKCAAISLS